MKKTVGLVLSGGGARGAAHIGVLQALDELKLSVSAISGVSAGAIIGALYASGLSPQLILKELKEGGSFGVRDIAWMKGGILSFDTLQKKLASLLGKDDFAYLKIPLTVAATDISTGRAVFISDGPLLVALRGSSSIPMIFEPVPYKGHSLVDGGILNNLPVEPLKGKYDIVVGSYVNKLYREEGPADASRFSLIDRCFHLAIDKTVRAQAVLCDVFIEPDVSGFGMFDMKKANQLFELGYNATMLQKEKLLSIMN